VLMPRDKQILRFLEENKAITIFQAYRIFFNEAKYGYDRARVRLKQLEKFGLIRSYKNKLTDQKVYYNGEKISSHDLYINEFYSLLVYNGCTNIDIKRQPRYLKDLIRPDAFIKFEYKDNIYFVLLEVDFTHVTSLSKFHLYEKLYKSNELQKQCFGTFPMITVISIDENPIKYESESLDIIYMNDTLDNFKDKILSY
jgi:replication initiation and membrane attachment protein DnaB